MFLRLSLLFVVSVMPFRALAQDSTRALEQRLKSNPNDVAVLMELGRMYYDMASAGKNDAIEKGVRCFDRLLQLDSTNAIALAYRGSMWRLRGLDSWWPPTKLNCLNRGTAELDHAVDLAPMDMMVRLIRGINELNLPESIGRVPVALEDFIVLLRHPDFPEQTRELKAVIYFYGGISHKRADDYSGARVLFKKAISILPGSEFAKRAQDALDNLGS